MLRGTEKKKKDRKMHTYIIYEFLALLLVHDTVIGEPHTVLWFCGLDEDQ